MWKLINKCKDEKRNTREILYWFTHQELRPVHLTPWWNPLKQIQTITAYTTVLEPFKNFNKQGWKTLFQHALHSKKHYQRVTNTYTSSLSLSFPLSSPLSLSSLSVSSLSLLFHLSPLFLSLLSPLFLFLSPLYLSLLSLSLSLSLSIYLSIYSCLSIYLSVPI